MKFCLRDSHSLPYQVPDWRDSHVRSAGSSPLAEKIRSSRQAIQKGMLSVTTRTA